MRHSESAATKRLMEFIRRMHTPGTLENSWRLETRNTTEGFQAWKDRRGHK